MVVTVTVRRGDGDVVDVVRNTLNTSLLKLETKFVQLGRWKSQKLHDIVPGVANAGRRDVPNGAE